MSSETLEKKLSSFIKANPYSSIGKANDEMDAIIRPWDDESLVILIPEDEIEQKELIKVLNKVVMPKEFSAIYHAKSKRLEVIWTAYRLPQEMDDVKTRQFDFNFNGNTHTCRFDSASPELVRIAKYAYPVAVSETMFRNIQSLSQYAKNKNPDKLPPSFIAPISFWINNVDNEPDKLVPLINNINFYMTYYDHMSPVILVHQDDKIEREISSSRYAFGKFPEKIKGRELNSTLKQFWFAGRTGDEARRFTYMYRIIEYASHHYIDVQVRSSLKKTLLSPHADVNDPDFIEQIVADVNKNKADEYARFEMLFRATVDMERLWSAVNVNLGFFAERVEFDGGFCLEPLVAPGCRKDDFINCGHLPKRFRDIRNALSHGRDQKTGTVITPTKRNGRLLQPWIPVITTAAGEVIMFHDAL